jgi:hypothetical protein
LYDPEAFEQIALKVASLGCALTDLRNRFLCPADGLYGCQRVADLIC